MAAASLELKMSTEKSDTEMDTDSDDDECSDYYDFNDDQETNEVVDPEYFEFKCLTPENVKKDIFIKNAESLCASLPEIEPSVGKLLLHLKGWSTSEIIASYRQNASKLLIDLRIEPPESPKMDLQTFRSCRYFTCSVCFLSFCSTLFRALACGHYFCRHCWQTCFEIQISHGITTTMECMDQGCNLLVPDDFVLNIINNPSSREKYQIFLFSDYVKHHPQLRFCPGQNCNRLFFAKNVQSKRVVCENCNIQICMKCGSDYHAPADCETMKKWLTKCTDDSETANYICANTKDCPKCDVCIEKNGGCNHIRCFHCKHEFCWICLRDWSLHARDYSCSMYQKPDSEKESVQSRSRKSLQKYLFYFERWENHARSLRLEEQTLQKIKNRIKKKVLANEGTWIDWQYLIDAADLLAKCRYTICYTYPYAFFMESSPDLILFEYQQAQLEAEIEDLSWKIERAETTDRGDLINKMYVAEKKRITLLKDFLAV